MNDIFLNFQSGLSPLMGNFGMSNSLGAQVPTSDGLSQDEDFVDLLSMASDVEVAESQLDGLDVKNEEMMESLKLGNKPTAIGTPSLSEDLVGKQNWMKPEPEKFVGQNVSQAPSETIQANQVLLDRSDALSMNYLQKQQMDTQLNAVTKESVGMWATAIASGDLKSVKLEQEPTQVQAVHAENFETNGNFVKTEVPIREIKPVSSDFISERDQLVRSNKLGGDAVVETKQSPAVKVAQNDNGNLFVNQHPANQNKQVLRSDVSQVESFNKVMKSSPLLVAKPSKEVKSHDAKDFLLNQQVANTLNNDATAIKGMPAFLAVNSLGEPGDSRISPDAVNFMADKIEALKAQGGGRLKLELNPQDLGGIEVRVSIQGGKLNVDMSAERQETMQAINNSRSELMEKLTQIAPVRLVVSEKATALSPAQSFVGSKTTPQVQGSSEDLLSMKDLSSSSQAQNVHSSTKGLNTVEVVRQNSNQSNIDPGGTFEGFEVQKLNTVENFKEPSSSARNDQSGWQRDERRDQARQKWQDFRERKSA